MDLAHDCPAPQAYSTSLYARTLHRACVELGGVRQLAQHLGATDGDVQDWITGIRAIPAAIFLGAVDVILGASPR